MINFCVIIPLGPSQIDVERAEDLLESLWFYEPQTPLVVLVDDGKNRDLSTHFKKPEGARIVTVPNPRNGQGIGPTSGLAAGMIAALDWIQKNTDVSFVVKLDTDALVIAPFADKIQAAIDADPQIGMIGLYDKTCDGQKRDQSSFQKMLRKLAGPAAVWRSPVRPTTFVTIHLWGHAATIERQIRAAIAAGYRPAEFILGGAYVISGEAMRRMAAQGYLNEPRLWLHTHFSEDIILSMYACAVGLRLHGMTGRNEPFAVQHYGLPDTPENLIERGYSLVHSLKGDKRFSEAEFRRIFQEIRATQSATQRTAQSAS